MSEHNNENPQGPERPNPYAQHAQAAAGRARVAAQDALGAARRLAGNPVAGIGEAHMAIGADRVLGVAIVFALVAAIGLALAGSLLVRAMMGAMVGGFGALPGMGFDFGRFMMAILTNLVAIIAAGGGVLMLAPMLGGRISAPSALLVAATAFLPLGIAALLSALIGSLMSNRFGAILISLLMLYGMCYLVLVLNAGLRHVAGVDERRAAYGTPTVLAFAAFVSWLVAWLFG
jgi:hypothetical protein